MQLTTVKDWLVTHPDKAQKGAEALTKIQQRAKCQEILRTAIIDQPISSSEADFLAGLIPRHPHAKQKIGCGVRHFEVRLNSRYGHREFWLVRTDGTATDFSFLECIAASPPTSAVKQAFRAAIEHQIVEFKRAAFAGRNSAPSAISGLPTAWDACEVDHACPYEFKTLLSRFLASKGLDLASVELAPSVDGAIGQALADETLLGDWRWYHASNAKLRIVSSEENQALLVQSRQDDLFGLCQVCGEPAGLITPQGKAYCGPCLRKENQ